MHVQIKYLNSTNEQEEFEILCEAFTYDILVSMISWRDVENKSYNIGGVKHITNIFVKDKYQVFKENNEK